MLFVVLLLALTAEAAYGSDLYFPRIHNDAEFVTGIAIANTTVQPTSLRLTLYQADGRVAAARDFQLAPRGQLVGTVSDLLAPPQSFQGWLRAASPTDISGLGILFKRDSGRVADSPAIVRSDRDQYFAHIAVGSGWNTELAVANPSAAQAECRASLFDESGVLVASGRFSLGPNAQLLINAQTLFNVSNALSGHIEISSTAPIVAAETFRTTSGLATVAGQGNFPRGPETTFTAYFPGVRGRTQDWSGIAYANPSADPTVVELRLFEDDGRLAAYSRAILPPKAQRVGLARDLAAQWSGSGYVTLSANGPLICLQLNGSGDPTTSSFSGWSALTDSGTGLYVPHVAQGEGWASVLNVINISPIDNNLSVRVVDVSGTATAAATLRLAPNQQITRSLADIAASMGTQLSGSVEILSEYPFLGTTVFQNSLGQVSVPLALPLDSYARNETGKLLIRQRVSAAQGGTLQLPLAEEGDPFSRIRLVIPPGALAADTEIAVYLNRADLTNADPSLSLVQFPFRFYPSGLVFSKPARITLPIPNEVIQSYTASLNAVQLMTYDGLQRVWVPVPIVERNFQNVTITAEISHFSDYAPQIDQRRPARDLGADIQSIFKLGGYGADVIEGVTRLLQAPTPKAVALGMAASVAADTIEIAQNYNDGNFLKAWAGAADLFGSAAGTLACTRLLGAETSLAFICQQAVDGVFKLSEIGAEKFGSHIGDIGIQSDLQKYQLQLNRYFYWLENRNTPFESMGRCNGGWLRNPLTDVCTVGDFDWPPPLGFLVKWDPLKGCILDYPCSPFNHLTLEGLNQDAKAMAARERRLLKEQAEAFRAALVQEILATLRETEVAKYPSSLFTVRPSLSGIAPFAVSFDGSSSSPGASPISSYTWDFGDGTRGAQIKTAHSYEIAGIYAVHLYVTDTAGFTVSNTRFITVNRNPDPPKPSATPVLTLNPASLSTPASTAVIGTGFPAGELITITWSDTRNNRQSSPQVRASPTGAFTYSLSFPVTAPSGDYTVFAYSAPSGLQSPEARLRVNSPLPLPEVDGVDPAVKTLRGREGAEDFDIAITGRNFVTGTFVRVLYARNAIYDGVQRRSGELTGVVLSGFIRSTATSLGVPVRLSPGEYSVVVVNPDNQESRGLNLTVMPGSSAPPTAVLLMSSQGQTAGNNGTLNLSVPVNGSASVSFDASGSAPGSGTITAYEWKSNGTVISTQSNFSYPFGTPSNTITLKVTNSGGQSATATAQVNVSVGVAPTAVISMSSQGQTAGNNGTLNLSVPVNGSTSVNFDAAGSTAGAGTITAYEWKSNGTVISTQSSFSYPFGTPSNTITLKVTNSGGQTATATAQVNVSIGAAPTAVLSMSSQGQTAGNSGTLNLSVPVNGSASVNFDASGSAAGAGTITAYEWKSNGTVISTQSSFSYPFGTPSNSIALKVTNSVGQSATATAQVNVSIGAAPTAVISMSSQGQTAGNNGTLNLSVPVNGSASVSFDASGSTAGAGTITAYEWKSNGTVISTQSSFSYPFGTPSNSIALKVTNSVGQSATATAQVNVSIGAAPTAVLSMSSQGQTAGNNGTLNLSVPVNGSASVNFDASGSTAGAGTITAYEWKSNGTVISTQSSFSYPFGTPSNSIALKVTNSGGQTATATAQVNVSIGAAPTAVLSMSSQGQTAGNNGTLNLSVPVNGSASVSFDASGSTAGAGTITAYEWKSNGTVISTQSNFSYPFGTPSNTITLKVTNSGGQTATATAQVNVSIGAAPTAVLSMSSQGQTAGNNGTLNLSVPVNGSAAVSFDASGSTAGTGTITAYEWRSNGTVISTQSSFSYPFGTPSNTITLKVTNSGGQTATATAQVNVSIGAAPTAVLSMSSQGQTAGNNGTLNLSVPVNGSASVSFDASGSTAGAGTITAYEWKSNGTVISTQSSFSYPFGTPSNTITLKVSNSGGQTATATAQVNVSIAAAPTAVISMSSQGQTAGNNGTLNLSVPVNGSASVSFDASGSTPGAGTITAYEWKSSGTVISTQSSFSYPFGTPSNTITLKVTNSGGQTATATAQVNVSIAAAPTAVLSISSQGQTAGNNGTLNLSVPVNGSASVSFDASGSTPGTGTITAYEWKSNGTVISTQSSFSYPFGTPSNTITLKVTNSGGQTATATAQINVAIAAAPTAVISISSQGQTAGNGGTLNLSVPVNGSASVSFDASGSAAGAGTLTAYEWKSNGTVISTQSSFSYPFGTPSNSITLKVTNSGGQTATATAQINVAIAAAPTAVLSISSQGQTAGNGGTLNLSVPSGGNASVSFDASGSTAGSGTITAYEWKSNGTVISTQSSFSYPFGTPSNSITLKVTNSGGQTATATAQINVAIAAAPTAVLSISSQGQTAGNGGTLNLSVPSGGNASVSFSASGSTAGSGTITAYEWKSNGTVISTQSSFSYPFGTPSNSIALKVTNSGGQTATATAQINVAIAAAPTAVLSMSSQGQTAGNGGTLNLSVPSGGNASVTFDASGSSAGSGTITAYEWKSNGTVISTQSSFSYPFGTPSNSITLKVTNSGGQTATATAQINVAIAAAPAAVISMSSQGQTAGNGGTLNLSVPSGGNASVSFNASGSTAGSGTITAYEWRSNGTVISTQSSFSYPFGTPSNSISLKVTNSGGQTSTATAQINVAIAAAPAAVISMSSQGQTAGNGGTLNLVVPVNGSASVNFNASGSTAGSGTITAYEWKSNGTVISTQSSFSFPFGTPSNSISLKVTNSGGQTATATAQINVTH